MIETARRRWGRRIVYVPVISTQGPAGARNAGWRCTQAPVIAFTDDDTVPRVDWLARGLATLDAGWDAVGGAIEMPLGPRPTDYERDAAQLSGAEFATANCFIRRDALVRVGGFDGRFTAAWREDSDLQFTLMEHGFRVGRTDACVTHPIRPERWGISLRQQRKGFHDALLFKKHPDIYRARIGTHLPVGYWFSVGALATGFAALAAGQTTVAPFAIGTWLALGLSFAARRLRGTSHRARHVAEMVVTSLLLPPLSVYWRLRGALHYRVAFL